MAEEELTEDYPKSELVLMSSNADIDINSLPNEILEYILSLTSPYCDLKSTLQVCKRWYNITKGVIRCYQQQFHKAIAGGGDAKLVWSSHQPETGPTVTERYSHSACYCNKSVYIFGGCTSTSTTFNDLWRFDLEHEKWVRPLATGTYPSPKACASLVAYKDSLILFGGWSHPTPYTFHQASRFFNQLHKYCPESNRWTQIVTVDSPEGIAGHGASIVDDAMVVFGGYHGHGSSSNAVWVLDLIQMVWTKKSVAEPKPLPRYSHAQICLGSHHILILGGCGGPNMQFSDVWLLDMSCEQWRWRELEICNPDRAPQQLWCHPACQIRDKLVVLGKNNARLSRDALAFSSPVVHQRSSRARALSAALPAARAFSPAAAAASSSSALPEDSLAQGGAPAEQPVVSSRQLEESSPSHTSGARTGRPSIRPNAMNDRRRQLEALDRYEDLLRAAARTQPESAARTQSVLPTYRLTSVSPGMCVYVLDLTEAIETGRVAWLPVKGADLAGAPDEAIFYSLVEGRGELMMFGGIRGDARSLQRGSSSEKRQIVLNDVHFLSFCGANIRKHS